MVRSLALRHFGRWRPEAHSNSDWGHSPDPQVRQRFGSPPLLPPAPAARDCRAPSPSDTERSTVTSPAALPPPLADVARSPSLPGGPSSPCLSPPRPGCPLCSPLDLSTLPSALPVSFPTDRSVAGSRQTFCYRGVCMARPRRARPPSAATRGRLRPARCTAGARPRGRVWRARVWKPGAGPAVTKASNFSVLTCSRSRAH